MQDGVAVRAPVDPDHHVFCHPTQYCFQVIQVVGRSLGFFYQEHIDECFVLVAPKYPTHLVVTAIPIYIDGIRKQGLPFLDCHVGRNQKIPALVFNFDEP